MCCIKCKTPTKSGHGSFNVSLFFFFQPRPLCILWFINHDQVSHPGHTGCTPQWHHVSNVPPSKAPPTQFLGGSMHVLLVFAWNSSHVFQGSTSSRWPWPNAAMKICVWSHRAGWVASREPISLYITVHVCQIIYLILTRPNSCQGDSALLKLQGHKQWCPSKMGEKTKNGFLWLSCLVWPLITLFALSSPPVSALIL